MQCFSEGYTYPSWNDFILNASVWTSEMLWNKDNVCSVHNTWETFIRIKRIVQYFGDIDTVINHCKPPSSVWHPYNVYKDGRHGSSPNVMLNHDDCPWWQAAVYVINPCLLLISWWDMDQTKKSKHMSNKFFSKMVSVILGSSHHTDVCSSVHLSGKFGFDWCYVGKWREKMAWNVRSDSWEWDLYTTAQHHDHYGVDSGPKCCQKLNN